jgi:hypothetical protein
MGSELSPLCEDMSDKLLPYDVLREQLRTSTDRMRIDNRRRREESERSARLTEAAESAVMEFDSSVGALVRQRLEPKRKGEPFDSAPLVSQVAARLMETLNILRDAGRLGVLDDLDLDLTFNHYRNSAFGAYPAKLARQALDFAVHCLRGVIEGKCGDLNELVQELFLDETVEPAGEWFRMLVSMLADRLRRDLKQKPSDSRSDPGDRAKDQQQDGETLPSDDTLENQSANNRGQDKGDLAKRAGDAGLSPSRKKAYQQYQSAVKKIAELDGATDRQVYDWLGEHCDDEDEKLPPFSTWSRYLRHARAYYGTSKNTRRAGRQTGRSIVGSDEI